MKTRYWIILFALLLVLCAGLSAWLLLPGENAAFAEVWSEGELLYTLDLRIAQSVTVNSVRGTNTVTVKDGAVAVTHADCPDGYCMARGFCSGGAQIVCLPNQLIIRFAGTQEIDGVVE